MGIFRRFLLISSLLIFTLSGVSALNYDVQFGQGWNMISVPGAVEADALSERCELNSPGGKLIWAYSNSSWEHPESLNPGLGYFVNAQQSCDVEMELPSEGSERLSLDSGWNMVSRSEKGGWNCLKGSKDEDLWHFKDGSWKKNIRLHQYAEE